MPSIVEAVPERVNKENEILPIVLLKIIIIIII